MINPLNPLENAVIWILNHLHDNLHLSYGWSIVVLTLIVRAALLPLVIRQYRSMRQMQVLAPQIKEMQRKYKGDKRKQQEELMRLYQENNANPFASCLPLVAQIPVFLGLYYGLKRFSDHVPQGSDLSFLHIIPNITEHVSALPIWSAAVLAAIYAGSQLLSTELSFEPQTPDMQRRIMRFIPIPIVLVAFTYPFPAGVAIYWVTTNLWTAGQMLIIKHRIGLHLQEGERPDGARSSRSAPKAEQVVLEAPTDDGAPTVNGATDAAAEVVAEDEGTGAPDVTDGSDEPEGGEAPAAAAPKPQGGQTRRKPRPRGGQGGQNKQRRQPKKRR
jgi:YidC/Oxa1 family membrane protein insertase